MTPNRPRGRQKNVTGAGKPIKRRGSGLGTGPVGGAGRGQGIGGGHRPSGGSFHMGGSRPAQRSGSGGGFGKLIILILVLLFGGGGGLTAMLGGGADAPAYNDYPSYSDQGSSTQTPSIDLEALLGGLNTGSTSSGWSGESNTGDLDTTVVSGAREKYTGIMGNGKDEMTILVYLCGTDLESRSKMATSDLQEMLNADLSDKVNLIVYTGGCKQWQNNVISSRTNQIWQVKDEGLVCLDEDAGSSAMVKPETLSEFIRYGAKKFPANRMALIFWDHGGGSVSGFGYDEKYASSGSMDLAEIDRALTDGGVKFDFVGFDACLMATTETALMLSDHADYLIASEETEPGIGWYYTDWLTKLSKNTSMDTVSIGKEIIDDFVDTCASKCRGQSTTLSIVDLAEAEATIPEALSAFSEDTCDMIRNEEYAKVSNARSGSREFGSSSRIDQVDLAHLAKNMGTAEGKALAKAIQGAVKYNRTSSNMTNAYGLSIYFPLRKASMVDTAVDTYERIGMDEEYLRCIQAFASMEVSGQAVSGGTQSPLPSLMDLMGSTGSSYGNADMMAELLGTFLGGDFSSIAELSGANTGFLSGRALDETETMAYLVENAFDGNALQWVNGLMTLEESQWELVQSLHANLFYDDGAGYIDMGMDNVFEFDDFGRLMAPQELTWIAVNDQPVAYYHESTFDDGTNYSILGRIPVLYNGERAELVVEFTDADPYGSVVGVRRVYRDGETETVAKTMDTVVDGDVIDFVCDYYSYEGEYLDSYMLGEQLIVDGELRISDVYVDAEFSRLTYLFTDIYNQQYWSEPVK
ncbi:MAG: peptidase C11 [Oscillospiraceae bacterium]|nr:peptidase C11 [Oscillospiraceae bacterium]